MKENLLQKSCLCPTPHLKEQFSKFYEHEMPWVVVGPVWTLIFTNWKVNHPAILEMSANQSGIDINRVEMEGSDSFKWNSVQTWQNFLLVYHQFFKEAGWMDVFFSICSLILLYRSFKCSVVRGSTPVIHKYLLHRLKLCE